MMSALIGSRPWVAPGRKPAEDSRGCDRPGLGRRIVRGRDEWMVDGALDRRFVNAFWRIKPGGGVNGKRGRRAVGWICLGLAAGMLGSCMATVSGTGEIQYAWAPGVLLLGAIATAAVGFGLLRG